MTYRKHPRSKTLNKKYPPSEPCNCAVCSAYCARPGWRSVTEAAAAIQAGYATRMMLELAPNHSFGVLSPAFRGCEGGFALQDFATKGCNFLSAGRCELHGTSFQPLECRFCHHERIGLGPRCHADLEKDWMTPAGQDLVNHWIQWMTGILTGKSGSLV